MRIVLACIILFGCCTIDLCLRLQETITTAKQWGTSDRVSLSGTRVDAIRSEIPARGVIGYEFHGREWSILPEIDSMRFHLAPLKVEPARDQSTILIDDGKRIVVKSDEPPVTPAASSAADSGSFVIQSAWLIWAWGLPALSLFCFLYSRSHFVLKESVADTGGIWAVWLFACSVVLGFGVSSTLFSLWNFFLGSPNRVYFVLETMIWLGGLVFFWRNRTYAVPVNTAPEARSSRSAWNVGLVVLFSLIGVSFCELLVWHERCPNGIHDAVLIWNLRARYLFRAAGDWSDAFAPTIWHPDYPLFLPASVARSWFYAGTESILIPAILGDLICLAMILILTSSVGLTRGPWAATAMSIVVLCTPDVVFQTMSQITDLPLACLFAIVITSWIHAQRWPSHWLTVGLGLGSALWMKNEGLVFLLISVFVIFVSQRPWFAWPAVTQRWAALASGIAIFGVTWIAFHLCFPTKNDLVAGQGGTTIDRLTDVARHMQILQAFAWQLLLIGPGLVVVLTLYGLLLGKAPRSRRPFDVAGPIVVLSGQLATYYFVYVTTPWSLKWHLETSLDRVLLHLWPSATYLLMIIVQTPSERLTSVTGSRKQRRL